MRRSVFALTCLLALASAVRAQDYPSGPVRLLGAVRGGRADGRVTRILAELLSTRWAARPCSPRTAPRRHHPDDAGGRQGRARRG